MIKTITACDYTLMVSSAECTTFADTVCALCDKDFCPAHIAGYIVATLAITAKMTEPTSQSAAHLQFSGMFRDAKLPICIRCGQSVPNWHKATEGLPDPLLKAGVEAVKAAFAAALLVKK